MTGRTHSSFTRTSSVPPGTRLSNIFQVDKALSAGGMGEVYKGHNIHTNDPVAIKIVLPEFAQDEMILELFRKEARILNHLHHDAIVRYYVFSIDTELGRPFLAMEFVEGPSLAERIRKGPLDTASVTILQKRLADGLQKAHEAGVIHRDIAPDNVILLDGKVERAKIIDFGIARSAIVGGGTLLGSNFAGKYNFASPEQLGLFGGEVTNRSDIYSLGLVLAACLRGKALDMSGTPVEVIEKRRSVPDLSGIDSSMRPLLEAMLQPDPQQRIASMAEVVSWTSQEKTEIGPPPRRSTDIHTAQPPPPEMREPSVRPAPAPPSEPARPARPAAARPEKKRSRVPQVLAGVAVLAVLGGAAGLYYAEQIAGGWYQTGPDQAVPGGDGKTVAVEPKPDERKSVEPKPDQPGPDQSGPDRAVQMAAFLNGYDGADCFFARPADVSDQNVTLIALGREDAFDRLRGEFLQRFGSVPAVRFHQVSAPQCAIVAALNRLIKTGANSPDLELDREVVQSGQNLSGTVSGFGNRQLEILVVDNQGFVQKLQYNQAGQAATFNVELKGELRNPEPQLILTVASAKPLKALAEPWPGGFIQANNLVPDLLDDAGNPVNDVVAAVKHFTFGGR